MPTRMSLTIALTILIAASLACSLAGPTMPAATPPPTAPPSPTPEPASTKPPLATFPSVAPPAASPTTAGDTGATDTPTPTPSPSPSPTTKASSATKLPPASSGPLSIKYEVLSITRQPNDQAVLKLKVTATGGGGRYRYYHDDILQSGPIFEVVGLCNKPFVHTLKVTSADGQSVRLPYFEQGKCPP